MKIPTKCMIENLRFTHDGSVWADFLLDGMSYGLRSPKEKERVRKAHQLLFRMLPGESLLLGLASGLDPVGVVDKMLAGIDTEQCPDWVAECEATLESLQELRPGQRVFWLSVPLGSDDSWRVWKQRLSNVFSGVESYLGLPQRSPSAEIIKRYRDKANRVLEGIPASFQPRPATPAQMVWLHQHMVDRGRFLDDPIPMPNARVAQPRKSAAALDDPLLDEAGTTDLETKILNPVELLKRRFLKVQSSQIAAVEEDNAASYQSMMMISDVPDGELPFPGGEILGKIDNCGFEVDWAIRLTVRTSEEVLRKNKRALENLNEQFNQREGEVSHGVSALERSAEDLSEYSAILDNDKLEVETQATVIISVAASNPEDVMTVARGVASWFGTLGYKTAAPIGYQEEMWWHMHPGVPTSSEIREYAQLTTSAALSILVPFASDRVGDSDGMLLGLNISNGPFLDVGVPCGPTAPVFYSPDGATDRNKSGAFAVAGELGSGKSFLLKKIAGGVLDRGGNIIVSDRTDMGEWVHWAAALTDPRVVDILEPEWSIDPLRLFPGTARGSRISQSFLTPLLNVSFTSPEGVLLAEVLAVKYLQENDIQGLGELIEHLDEECVIEGAAELARLMKVFARQDLGRVVFDPTLPALGLDSRAIIFRTAGMSLPSRNDIEHEHLFKQLGIEKIFGRALFALITALAKDTCFVNRDVLAAFIVDEAHAVTISDEAVAEIKDFVRDGRKHRAIVALGSHDPFEDYPTETLRGLIPNRVAMRHTDKTLASNAAQWLGFDSEDEYPVELLSKDTSPEVGGVTAEYRRGEGILRDSAGNIARIKVLPPSVKERDQAARTGGRGDLAA